MTFGAVTCCWTLAVVLITFTFIDGEDATYPLLQRRLDKRIMGGSPYTGFRSQSAQKTTKAPDKRGKRQQRPQQSFDYLASLVVPDIDSGQDYEEASFENRLLPAYLRESRLDTENENEARAEVDDEERFWRTFLTALASTIDKRQSVPQKRIFCNRYTGCRSVVPEMKNRQSPDKRQSYLQGFDDQASLSLQNTNNGKHFPASSFKNRQLPELITRLQKTRETEDEDLALAEDDKELLWRFILTVRRHL